MSATTTRPWYRQLWPWLLMLPPVLSVVGGAVTYYLAVTRPESLVSQDCVQDGVTMRCGETDSYRTP
jgi:uncharacterized protein